MHTTWWKGTKRIVFAVIIAVWLPNGARSEETKSFDFLASGNWGSYTIGQDGARAVTNTNLDDVLMSLDFPSSDCSSAYLMIHVSDAQVSDIGKSQIVQRNIKLRVDTKDIWSVDEVNTTIQESADGRSAVLVLAAPVNTEFLAQVRNGTTLRVKIEDLPAFRASLRGSRNAVNRAAALCHKVAEATKDDDRYFERRVPASTDDERYF